jgi:predicted MFS family arabinose efflux permease
MCVGGAGLLAGLILFFTSAAWEDPRLERQMMALFIIGQFILAIGIAYWLIYLTRLVGQ